MNQPALLDGVLAAVCAVVAWYPGRSMPALRLGAGLLGATALLGALRLSGLLPLPRLHQAMSMFSAGVALPLLGVSMVWPNGVVARQARYAWIFAVAAGVACVLVAVMAGIKAWPPACAVVAVGAMLACGLRRQQELAIAASLTMAAALLGFATGRQAGWLAPGDLLHAGLAVGIGLYGGWARTQHLPQGAPSSPSA